MSNLLFSHVLLLSCFSRLQPLLATWNTTVSIISLFLKLNNNSCLFFKASFSPFSSAFYIFVFTAYCQEMSKLIIHKKKSILAKTPSQARCSLTVVHWRVVLEAHQKLLLEATVYLNRHILEICAYEWCVCVCEFMCVREREREYTRTDVINPRDPKPVPMQTNFHEMNNTNQANTKTFFRSFLMKCLFLSLSELQRIIMI